MTGTYVADIDHYLDDEGEIVASMPTAARKFASFLTLLIDSATVEPTPCETRTAIRCRKRNCAGLVQTVIRTQVDAIEWQCPHCHQNGLISNWQNTKWDNRTNVDI